MELYYLFSHVDNKQDILPLIYLIINLIIIKIMTIFLINTYLILSMFLNLSVIKYLQKDPIISITHSLIEIKGVTRISALGFL